MIVMERVFAIAKLTFVKLREPAFLMLMAVGACLGSVSSEMGTLMFREGNSLVATLIVYKIGEPVLSNFSLIVFVVFIVSVFSGATEIPRDVKSRMIMLILAKPVSRWEYLLGKFLGVLTMGLAFLAVSFSAVVAAHFLKTGSFYPPGVLMRQILLALVVLPCVAISVAVSTFLPEIASMVLAVLYMIAAVAVASIGILVEMLPHSLNAGGAVYSVYYLFPNFIFYFNSFHPFGLVSFALLVYTLSVTAILLWIAWCRLSFRDMV